MASQAELIRAFLLKQLSKHPQDVVAVASHHFQVTRTTIHRHLNHLVNQGKIIKTGITRQIRYSLPSQKERTVLFKLEKNLSESEAWRHYQPLVEGLKPNVISIIEYGFTEIFNNAIDHSGAKKIEAQVKFAHGNVIVIIKDDGIGVYERIRRAFHFEDYKECLLHLTKGKLTTDNINHSGEGLFFTVRVFDEVILQANGISFYRNNILNDWSLEKTGLLKGTSVTMKITKLSARKIADVFEKYTELEDFKFVKTDVLVDLSKLENERLISRSQAKSLLSRLEPFSYITLDFLKVIAVGQGFVDEVFRVYPLKHPKVMIDYVNANEEVEFMIKRSLPKV